MQFRIFTEPTGLNEDGVKETKHFFSSHLWDSLSSS